uniref:Uncharacterized protein n=1 Tax=Romanomermis culicivorax TaxID=13658 RepID=A0A915JEL1_ROMCU
MHIKFNPEFLEQIPPELSQLQASLELALVGSFEDIVVDKASTQHQCFRTQQILRYGKYDTHRYERYSRESIHRCDQTTGPLVQNIDLQKTNNKMEKFVGQEFHRCHEQCKQ